MSDRLPMRDADVRYYADFFTSTEAAHYLDILTRQIAWEQGEIKLYGKTVAIPRLTAWYGDPSTTYSYSGLTHDPLPWTDTLISIKKRVETVTDSTFNSVLLNLYRDGTDSVGWHSDDEPELGENPVIASVSFGATRRFQFRHKADKSEKHSIELTSGSLLLMQWPTQHHWQHTIPKTRKTLTPRINLTFRVIYG